MRFFAASFMMQLKRLARGGATLACLLAAPLLTLALGLALPADAAADPVRVGVLMPEGPSPAAQRVWQGLAAWSDEDIRFELADSRADLEARVGAALRECGYILPEDLDARLENGDTARLLTRVDSPSTTLASNLDWMLAATLLDICAPDIALGQLEAAGIPSEGADAPDDLRRAAEAAFTADSLMRLEVAPVGGQDLSAGAGALTGASLARGMVALLLLLYSCLCAARFAEDRQAGFFARLAPYAGPAGVYFPAFAACAALGGLAGGVCLAIGAGFFPGQFAGPLKEGWLLVLYLVYLAAFSFVLSAVFRGRGALVGLLPFLLVACLLLCPILIDLSQYLPAGKILAALLPPTLYLRAAAGQAIAIWSLLGGSLVLFIAGRLFSVAKRGRRWYTH